MKRFEPALRRLIVLVGPLLIIGLWWVAAAAKWVSPKLLPDPWSTLQTLWTSVMEGAIWADFLGGQRKWHTHLWSVLMFQAWREHAMRPGGRAEP